MRIVDVDSHFMEPPGWLEHFDPALAEELPKAPPDMIAQIFAAGGGAPALPEIGGRHEAAEDLIYKPVRAVAEQRESPAPYAPDEAGGDPSYCAPERVELLDAAGIDVQWLNPTNLMGPQARAITTGREDLLPRVNGAWNTFAATQVAGYEDRLQPITQIFVHDVEWSVKEMTRMREAGSRAFGIDRHTTKSITHPDFEPLWDAAEDLGMAAYVHIVFGQVKTHESWANNGREGKGPGGLVLPSERRLDTRRLLTALALDGVFENHPNLRIVIAEGSYSWLPIYMREVDHKVSMTDVSGLPKDAPLFDLPMLPSEYMRRHVRVSPLIGFMKAGVEALTLREAYDLLPDPDMYVFSTDYPHLEGNGDAVAEYAGLLPDDQALHARFYGASMDDFLERL